MHASTILRSSSLFAIAAFAISLTVSVSAQAVHSAADTAAHANAAMADTSTSTMQNSASSASSISAQLTQKLDSKNARVGDQVMAKTTSSATLTDGTMLPKNTKLVGKVTDVRSKSKADNTSHLAFAFDRALLATGEQVPIHAMLTSVSAPAVPVSSNDDDAYMTPMADLSAAPAPMASNNGIAPVNNVSNGIVSSATPAAPPSGGVGSMGRMVSGPVRTTGSVAGNGYRSTSGMVSSAGNSAAGAPQGKATVSLGTGNVMQVDRAPVGNMTGVTFSSVVNSSSSGVLDASDRNINLSSGTQMNLAVSAGQR